MQVILGYDLDTGSYPDALEGKEACEGVIITGPARLTSILETRLGLCGGSVHQAVRIGEYLKRLKAADDNHRFYSRSIEADAWSTAKKLLSWRDDLFMAGWKGNVPRGTKGRLEDLADVEQLSGVRLDPSLGERLQNLLSELVGSPKLDIRRIGLVEPLESWPPCWQRLLRRLAACGIELSRVPQIPPADGTDLGILREAMQRGRPAERSIRGDDSLCLLLAEGEWEAAETVASWLDACRKDLDTFLIVRGKGSPVLDNLLQAYNLPGLGVDSRSQWRTSLQVLSLVLANTWEPFEPHRLLELLLLPKSPVPKRVARRFERALRSHPGTGGPEWVRAWDESMAEYREGLAVEKDAPEYGSTIAQYEKRIRFWLGEKRYHPDAGMPAEVIKEICSKVTQWAAIRGERDRDPLLMTSASMAKAVSMAVEATGFDSVSRPQLDRILDTAVGEGLENPDTYPRAAPWSQVRHAGQIWAPAKTIVWWDFTNPESVKESNPWFREERKVLESLGVELEPSSQARAREAQAWKRAIKWASNRLVLIAERGAAERSGALHPLWDEIRYLLKLKEPDIAALAFNAARARQEKSSKLSGVSLNKEKTSKIPMPCACREWKIPSPDLCALSQEHFTSMQKLLQCPLSWVFEYVLGLSSGDLVSLPDGSQMIGTFSHAIVERLFSKAPRWEPSEAQKAAEALFDELVPQMAVTLLHPGRELERIQYRQSIGKGVYQLTSFLNSVKLRVKKAEHKVEKPLFPERQFKGKVDLLLATEKDEPLFLDLKWTRSSKYKRQEMEEGRPLQLAVYSWLLSEDSHAYPPGGYYLLSQGEVYFSSCSLLPDQVCFSASDTKSVWVSALNAYKKRMADLEKGIVVAEGIQSPGPTGSEAEARETKDPAASPPSDSLCLDAPCRWCAYTNLCGKKE